MTRLKYNSKKEKNELIKRSIFQLLIALRFELFIILYHNVQNHTVS